MEEYRPPTSSRIGKERLDFNENTVGCSPKVIQTLRKIGTPDFVATYPEYGRAKQLIGDFFGLKANQVLLSDGTDEGIHILVQTYIEPGDEVVTPWPAFPMYRFYTQVAGGVHMPVALREPDLSFPVDELLAAIGPKTRAVIIANPNNPTGGAIGLDVVEQVLQKAADAAVLIDEAYFEFYGVTALELIPQYPNLFVSRTFSKAYGLAGLRVGCILSQAENIAAMRKGQSPYSVNSIAVACALAAIEDSGYVEDYVEEVLDARKLLLDALDRLGIPYFPTEANFVLTTMGDRAKEVVSRLRERDILVRDRSAERPGTVRLTVGNMEQTEWLISALEEIYRS
ncbi:MAG: histidinol-phosphate aminotransferase family protein [Bryobacterales bacterium]|nr:histidinol-phosphate aminotransferase family protein [Acidobacteriota bacterium]MCB9383472.1 histidinol-phosphate aminotransferase family protein [Bryobacterales bacterium]